MPFRAFTLAVVAFALCACGLRGPLYLPSDKPPAESEQASTSDDSTKSRRPAPAPQSQKRDRGAESDSDSETAAPTAPTDPDRPANVPTLPPGD